MVARFPLTVLLVFSLAVSCSGIWVKKRSCNCQAVNNYGYHEVLHDFLAIQRCKGWRCRRCRHSMMRTCEMECVKKVREWVCHNNCDGLKKGMHVRAQYHNGCKGGTVRDIFVCGSQKNCRKY